MFSLVISTAGERVLHTGQALMDIINFAYCAPCITWDRQLPNFSPLFADNVTLTFL